MNQYDNAEEIELNIKPVPPDTVESVKADFQAYVESVLQQEGHEDLVSTGQVKINIPGTFPTDEVVKIIITISTSVAIEVIKATVIPRIKDRFDAWWHSRKKDS